MALVVLDMEMRVAHAPEQQAGEAAVDAAAAMAELVRDRDADAAAQDANRDDEAGERHRIRERAGPEGRADRGRAPHDQGELNWHPGVQDRVEAGPPAASDRAARRRRHAILAEQHVGERQREPEAADEHGRSLPR